MDDRVLGRVTAVCFGFYFVKKSISCAKRAPEGGGVRGHFLAPLLEPVQTSYPFPPGLNTTLQTLFSELKCVQDLRLVLY